MTYASMCRSSLQPSKHQPSKHSLRTVAAPGTHRLPKLLLQLALAHKHSRIWSGSASITTASSSLTLHVLRHQSLLVQAFHIQAYGSAASAGQGERSQSAAAVPPWLPMCQPE